MRRRHRTRSILLALTAFALALAGIGAAGWGVRVRAADATVKITDSSYDPKTVTVTAGSVVAWNNTGTKAHTVTADDGSFDSGPLTPGDAFGNLFDKTGTFGYHDTTDPTHKGSVVVKAAAPTPTPNGTPKPTPPPGTLPPGFGSPSSSAVPAASLATAEPSASQTTDASSSSGTNSTLLVVALLATLIVVAVLAYQRLRRPPSA